MVKKKLAKDEIDLIEIFQIIWGKKRSIIISIIFGLLIAFLIQLSEKPSKITAKTKIIPISIYDESKFQIYNSIAKMIKPMPLILPASYETYENTMEEDRTEIKRNHTQEIKNIKKIKNTEINNITKSILLEMFIETFEERAILKTMIKRFNFIKKEDYPNNVAYEIAIDETLSAIELLNTESLDSKNEVSSNAIIVFESNNPNEWENFLSFAEKEINQRVQIKLSEMFEMYLSYTKMLNKFNVEDLEARLAMVTDDEQELSINQAIDELRKDKYSKRLVDIFNSSPITNKDEFYAAKIGIDLTTYELTTNKISLKTLYSSAALLSGILGIFFVLVVHSIRRRS